MNARRVKLDRRTILELDCRLFQGVAGLAGSSEFNWAAFQGYYHPNRVAEIERIMERIRRLLPAEAANIETAKPPACLSPDDRWSLGLRLLYAIAGPLMVYVWPLFNGRKSSWSFPCQELTYTLNRLQAFLDLLQTSGHPGYEKVVPLRMELHSCCWLIERRCHGVRELKRIHLVEYFNKAPHAATVPLSAIINSSFQSAA